LGLISSALAISLLALPATARVHDHPAPAEHARDEIYQYDPADRSVAATLLEGRELYDPGIAVAPDGTWLCWLEFLPGNGDRMWVGRRGDDGWALREPVPDGDGRLARPTLTPDGAGGLWLSWEACNPVGEQWDLFARRRIASGEWTEPLRVSPGEGADLDHRAIADPSGGLWVVWQSDRDGQFDVLARAISPEPGAELAPVERVSESGLGDWRPDLALAPDGELLVVWDAFDGESFDVLLRRRAGGRWGKIARLTSTPAFEGRARIACDPGGRAWVLWEEGSVGWGRPYRSVAQKHTNSTDGYCPLHGLRKLRVAALARDGSLVWPTKGLPMASLARGAARPDRREGVRELGVYYERGELVVDGGGRPWVVYRHFYEEQLGQTEPVVHHVEKGWRLYARCLQESGWSELVDLDVEQRDGMQRLSLAPLEKGVAAAWDTGRTDRRKDPRPRGVATARIELDGAPAPAPLAGGLSPAGPAPAAPGIRPARPRPETLGGEEYHLAFGDLHRHTDLSLCFPFLDGSIDDAYRYAIEVADLDFLGITDHTRDIDHGNALSQLWWRSAKEVERHRLGDRFFPYFAYERSHADTDHNVVSLREDVLRDFPPPVTDFWAEIDGDTITIPHNPFKGSVWEYHDDEKRPLLEIYQGYRDQVEDEPAREGLDHGYHFGFIASSDHLSTGASYACAWTPELSREGIFRSLQARRTYGATDRIRLVFRSGEHWMGERFESTERPVLNVDVVGTAPIAWVDLWVDGIREDRFEFPEGVRAPDLRASYSRPGIFIIGEHRAWVHVMQEDGNQAWSSPIWWRGEGDWARVPGAWEDSGPETMAEHDGFAWVRRPVRVPRAWSGDLLLELGRIDDCDEVFFNGERVGATGTMPPVYRGESGAERRYSVPEELAIPGMWNALAVRVYDEGGSGGILEGPLRLSCEAGEQRLEGLWEILPGDDASRASVPGQLPREEAGMWLADPLQPYADGFQHVWREQPVPAALTRTADRDPDAGDLSLWYERPAEEWTEALPVGNGRLGAMVFGGVTEERLQLNEDTFWTGAPGGRQNPEALENLPRVRSLLEEGRQAEAHELAMAKLMSIPLRQEAYQPLGDLRLFFPVHQEVEDYHRELDLDAGVARVRYRYFKTTYTREVLASHPDQAIAVRLACDRPGGLDFAVSLTSPQPGASTRIEGDSLILEADARTNPRTGVESVLRAQARARLRVEGGEVRADGERLVVEDADAATLVLVAATSYVDWRDASGRPGARCRSTLKSLGDRSWDEILARHQADHRELFRRVSLDLGATEGPALPTDERVRRFAERSDPDLVELLFQYGRYLLIASSRPGGQPANLQGLWNDRLDPPWGSKYTVNINAEMNYWPAEPTGLSECCEPLFTMLDELAVAGRRTAEVHYGSRGWVLHHNTDLWRGTAPINHSNHGIWVTGGAWLARHLWEHYLFTLDEDFLRERAWPVLRGAALFFADFLVEDPETGWLISTPSNSPEQGGLVAGPTMDHQIVRALFDACIQAGAILGEDAELCSRLAELRARIAPDRVGQHGQLQEWLEDVDDPNNHHRHVSHMWALHPGDAIHPLTTPELADACRVSLGHRGDGGTGWSLAWKINLWARLLDGDHAYRLLGNTLRLVGSGSDHRGGGVYANLMGAHPPFQIDGNFGTTSGVCEMLLQSHAGEIHLLPALPGAWPDGFARGLRARGAVEVDVEWREGALVSAVLRREGGGSCRLRCAAPLRVELHGREVPVARPEPGVILFEGPAAEYRILPRD